MACRRTRAPALLALSLCLWTGSLSPALGHATLLRTTPADQAILTEGTDNIALVFSEPVSPLRVEVVDSAGERLPVASVMAHDEAVHVVLGRTLAPGGYLVSWRVISADSHPIAGAFAFAVGSGSATPAPPVEAGAEAWQLARIAVRALRNAALMIAAGGALFLGLILREQRPPPPVRGVLLGSGILAVALGGLELGLQGGLMRGGPPAVLLDSETWRLASTTTLGRSIAAMILGLMVAGAGLVLHGMPGRLALIAGGTVAAASLAVSGHAASGSAAAAMALALHTTAVAFWLGAFLPLLALLRAQGAACAFLVRRFSNIGVWIVGVLIAAGVVLSLTRLHRVGELIDTSYGRILSIKLLIVLILLTLAAANRLRIAPALERTPQALPRLARNIRAEIAVGALLLLATAVLAHTPPPQAMTSENEHVHTPHAGDTASAPCVVTLARENYVATARIVPAARGTFDIVVLLATARGEPVDAKEVVVQLRAQAQDVELLDRPLAAAGRGRFEGLGLLLPITGPWEVRIEALIGDFDKLVFAAAAGQTRGCTFKDR